MASRTSSLTVELIDDVSKPARTVADALKQAEAQVRAIDAAMGAAPEASGKLVSSLAKLGASSADIDAVANAWRDYTKAAGLAADSDRWTKQQITDVKAWERQTVDSVRAVMAERRNEAAAMRNLAREQAADQAAAIKESNRMVEEGIAAQVAMIKKSHEEQLTAQKEFRSKLGEFTSGIGGMILGSGLVSGVKDMAKNSADLAQERFKIQELSTMDASEAPFANNLAAELAKKYPNLTEAENLKTYQELRFNALDHNGIVDKDRARANMETVARAQTAALALGVEMTPEDTQNLLKAVEISGRANDPTAVGKMFDAYLRGKQSFGTALTSEKIRDMVQNAKAANFGIGEEEFFWQDIVRDTEMNSSRLGNETAQTMQTLLGGHAQMQTAKWLQDLGLSEGFEKTGGGHAKIIGLKGADTLQTNNIEWVNEFLIPALKAKGYLSDEVIKRKADMLRKDAPNMSEEAIQERAMDAAISEAAMQSGMRATVTDLLTHSAINAPLIKRDVAGMKNNKGVNAAEDVSQNPMAAFKELTDSIANFAAVLGGPALAKVAPVMDTLAHGISNLAASMKDMDPNTLALIGGGTMAAGGAGGLYLLMRALGSGFGLRGSAGALSASAAELSAAAGALKVGAAAEVAAAEKSAAAIPGLLGSIVGAGGLAAYLVGSAPDSEQGINDQAKAFNDWFNSTSLGKMLNGWVGGKSGGAGGSGGIGSDAVAGHTAGAKAATIDMAAQIDTSALDVAAAKKAALASPVVLDIETDTRGLDAILDKLAQIKRLAASVSASGGIGSDYAASLNSAIRGNFSYGGINGE